MQDLNWKLELSPNLDTLECNVSCHIAHGLIGAYNVLLKGCLCAMW